MKYCCEYAYRCPERAAVACYVHGGADPCCSDEAAHTCLRDMYGSEDGLMFGDGFQCLRCGNYELVGMEHEPASEPGFPRRQGLPREHWFEVPEEVELVVFSVEEVFDIAARGGLLVVGELASGKIGPGTVLRTADGRPVTVLGLEFPPRRPGGRPPEDGTAQRLTLLVDRADAPPLGAGAVLTS
ncbi:hypothetical protein [Kribbella sp. NPDC023855]|uniref:hypothetical protein n=1 Tax=Kribbella sp. NPDC023855 TaxID=3154698 RepID=UPI0033EBD1D9